MFMASRANILKMIVQYWTQYKAQQELAQLARMSAPKVRSNTKTGSNPHRARSQQKRRRLMRQCNSTHGKSGRW